ncbi:MAG: hypothetical protein R6X09_05835 [Bacteroidales bacterium]
MCLFREFHLQGLRSPKMRSLLFVNEQLSDKRNAANGALWADKYKLRDASILEKYIKYSEKTRPENQITDILIPVE